MANLVEASTLDAVYQLETVDDVIGGAGGLSNRQGQQLLNRTKWLQDHAVADDTNALGNYTIGDLFYATAARTLGKRGIGASGTMLRSSGSAPTWSTATFPNTAAAGDVLIASATNTWASLAIGSAGKLMRSSGAAPTWSTATFPDTAAAGDLAYGSALNTWSALAIGASNKVLQSTGSAPQWTDTVSLAQLTVTTLIVSGDLYSGTGTDTLVNGVATNIFNITVVGLYLVTAIGGADYAAEAVVRVGSSGTTKVRASSTNAGNFDIDVAAGNNVTLREAVGGPLNCKFRYLRILHD